MQINNLPETPPYYADEIQQLLADCTQKWWSAYQREFPQLANTPLPQLRFDIRTKRKAGYVKIMYDEALDKRSVVDIRLNIAMAERNWPEYEHTIVHELAHVAACYIHGKHDDKHGPKWKAIMRQMGASPDRTHQYNMEGIPTRQIITNFNVYECACRGYPLTRQEIPRPGQYRVCQICEQNLVDVGDLRQLEYFKLLVIGEPDQIGMETLFRKLDRLLQHKNKVMLMGCLPRGGNESLYEWCLKRRYLFRDGHYHPCEGRKYAYHYECYMRGMHGIVSISADGAFNQQTLALADRHGCSVRQLDVA